MVLVSVKAMVLVVVDHMVPLKRQDTAVVADHMVPLKRQGTTVVADHMVPLKQRSSDMTSLATVSREYFAFLAAASCWQNQGSSMATQQTSLLCQYLASSSPH